MEGHCRAKLTIAETALDFGDLNEATRTLSPLWRCSTYSDCRLRKYCSAHVEVLTQRIHNMDPLPMGSA